MQGYNVLYPMGWDAFGLPTENYAIKNKVHPKEVTKKNVARFKEQLHSLGYSFDWDREINTTDPDYYKWTQWIFLKLFNAGLAYKKEMPINWCTSCKVGLANEEVVNGVCERCGSPVVRKVKSEWMLKITNYADKLLEGLNDVDYIERVKTSQRNWIGRSEGAEVDFRIKDKEDKLSRKDKAEEEELLFATVQVPSVLPRVVQIPSKKDGDTTVILLEEIIERNIDKLFLSYDVVCAHPYRIMRNADLTIDEDEAEDLLVEIQRQLKKRQWGEVIRLEVEDKMDERLLKILKMEFDIKEADIFEINGPLDLTMLMKVYGAEGFDAYKTPRYQPAPVPEFQNDKDIFQVIREGDVFLHHPYMSFDPVVNFVRQAAKDPDVLAIKQTLYRVSGNSPIIAALAQAAENGKQVSVLVELKARFDEENNIVWAKKLEKAGCHVIYGLVGLKTHSKITLVVRREETGIRRYVHLATGNYNDSTAKLYTDCGIFTCDERFGEDATAVFNMLSGYSEPKCWNKLIVAPIWMKDRFLSLIEREAENAKKGLPAHIRAKMNSLCDPKIMAGLYYASSCGVQVELLVRGICCLKVGIPGVSENIQVRSIVGEFLEHSRIFYFENGGNPEIYMGSADWMPRNLDRRVEIVFPVEDDKIKKELEHVLDLEFRDNVKAHLLQTDGTYTKQDKRGKVQINSQMEFCMEATEKAALHKHEAKKSRVFIPAEPAEDIED